MAPTPSAAMVMEEPPQNSPGSVPDPPWGCSLPVLPHFCMSGILSGFWNLEEEMAQINQLENQTNLGIHRGAVVLQPRDYSPTHPKHAGCQNLITNTAQSDWWQAFLNPGPLRFMAVRRVTNTPLLRSACSLLISCVAKPTFPPDSSVAFSLYFTQWPETAKQAEQTCWEMPLPNFKAFSLVQLSCRSVRSKDKPHVSRIKTTPSVF